MKISEWVFQNSKFSMNDLSLPDLVDGEVLISVKKVGICGSDLFAMETIAQDRELRLGHEWVGEIVETKSNKLSIGDLVTSTAVVGCGKCPTCISGKSNYCKEAKILGGDDFGMLRTKVILSATQLLKVKNYSLNEIVLLEVAAVAEEAISQVLMLGMEKRNNILVFGGGPVGLLTALRLKEEKYNYTLIEVDSFRVKLAASLGVNVLPLAMGLVEKNQFDFIIDTSGNGNSKSGFWKYFNTFAKTSCKCLIVGKYKEDISINSNLFAMKDATVKWMRGMPSEILDNTRKFWLNKFDKIASKMITHEYSFEEVQVAFDKALKREKCMKVVINVS